MGVSRVLANVSQGAVLANNTCCKRALVVCTLKSMFGCSRQVDSMVDNLKQRFKHSGVNLPLEKHSGCQHTLAM